MHEVVYKTPDFWSQFGQWIVAAGFWIPINIIGLLMLDYCLRSCGIEFEGFGFWERIRQSWSGRRR